MFEILLGALVLGLVGGAVPGPILTAVFTEILGSGFRKGIAVILKALVAESLIALIVLLAFSVFSSVPSLVTFISIIGALVLFWLAWQVWRIEKLNLSGGKVFTFPKIILLTVTNGGFWVFWITICLPRGLTLEASVAGGKFLWLFVFEMGWLLATTALAVLFSFFRPILEKKNLVAVTFKVLAFILAFFGVQSLLSGMNFFLE